MISPLPALYLCGPTASGKTGLALAIASLIPAEIVNADAFQLYCGLPICTAKPSAEELSAAPHHLVGTQDPGDTADAQRYHDLARPILADILARGRWPIVVGGTGLYIKSLTHGLANLPKADASLRAELMLTTAAERRQRLLDLDPRAAENVPLANDRYVVRALEICLLTGQPQSQLRQTWQDQPRPQLMGICLQWQRDELYQRINARTHSMMASGLVNEVTEFLTKHCPESLWTGGEVPSSGVFRAIGVREIAAHRRGETDLATTVEQIQQATRNYAKRQLTWFRREAEMQTICLDPDSTAKLLSQQILSQFPCLLQLPPSVQSLSI
jgi:tRNA dimethylallyltransferase